MQTTTMALSDEELKANLAILKELDELLADGPWEHNLFFKGIGKKLKDARDHFVEEMGLEKKIIAETPEQTQLSSNFQEVYISLYQAEGTNIAKWQTVVNSLAGFNITRPIYKNEDDIKNAIRNKSFKQNDAYAVMKIPKDAVLKPFNTPATDRLGHELVVLREGVVKLENITRFVHQSGEYEFRNHALHKKHSIE